MTRNIFPSLIMLLSLPIKSRDSQFGVSANQLYSVQEIQVLSSESYQCGFHSSQKSCSVWENSIELIVHCQERL